MNYRDKTDISATILEVVNGGASKSKIISIAFLNHSSSLQYFRMLLKNNLLIYQKEKRMFKTTPTGIQFLQLYHLMNELVNENNNLSSIQGATRRCWTEVTTSLYLFLFHQTWRFYNPQNAVSLSSLSLSIRKSKNPYHVPQVCDGLALSSCFYH